MSSGRNIHQRERLRKQSQYTLSDEERAAVAELAERHGVDRSVIVGRGMLYLRDHGIDLSAGVEEKSTEP